MTQNDALLALLRQRGSAGVSPLLALEEIGCFRLAARVWDLRKEGNLIVNHPLKVRGNRIVACYVLEAPLRQLTMEEVAGVLG